MSDGKLLGIAIRARSRAEMLEHREIEINRQYGVVGDFRGKPGKRQVTVLSMEAWQLACDELGNELPWTTRRANLLVSGVDLCETTGQIIQLGEVQLKITGETDPCDRMDEYATGLQRALMPQWRGGVCCQVISEGAVAVGDQVTVTAKRD